MNLNLIELANFFSDSLIVVSALGTSTFLLSYASFFNWKKTEAGRALMYFVLSLEALVLRSFIGRATGGGDVWWWLILTLVVYGAIGVTIWRLVYVLWKNWHSGSDRPLALEAKSRDKKEL